jgi:hypothetical protein
MHVTDRFFYLAIEGVYSSPAAHRGHFYRRYRIAWLAELLFAADCVVIEVAFFAARCGVLRSANFLP